MYYALYTERGSLVGVTNTSPVAMPGISIKELTEAPDLAHTTWNVETLEFERHSTMYTKLEFMSKFTNAERIAARNSTDPVVVDILDLLNLAEFVDVSDPKTQQGVYYLSMAGIIAADRVPEILQ